MEKLNTKDSQAESKLFADVWEVYKTYYQIEKEEEAELLRAEVDKRLQPYKGTQLEEMGTKMFLDIVEDIARRAKKKKEEHGREVMVFTA